MITTLPPVVFVMKKCSGNSIWIGISIVATLLVASIRAYAVRKSRDNRPPGSVTDLVRRGQLRSGDRRGISKSLDYEDPFNNPFVKLGKGSSTVEMCGKVYKLAPVTLTEKEQSVHQKRRSRAYQWKRPTVFLKEGDSIPPDVDPDIVRWIPANHPFATTVSDIDQNLAQNNVYQKQGVPFRIRAEHEAMQKKLEALQNEEKLNNLGIDSQNARDFQRPHKFSGKLEDENVQKSSQENHTGDSSSEETH
ncbi:multiple chloroplast division site 1 [Raphanus sativus]|uniref:Protein MULTIPLE CHLOROPLAST DIVISION SITE 1 n=1 Tax=Raphanus sativus TaxID=3726 RepID=A0A6J0KV61_RAPSA|nr:protein MULTIPLE CHLOROPLAST DIVISION SITE 1 [Raphanus sativus]KAJ4879573.1 multiple chloroplast division site 1 [Raphanus sativus]